MALTKVTGGLLGNLPTGTNNVAVGDTALDSIESGAQYNVAIGSAAGTAITTGDQNTLIGGLAGDAITTAANNTAVGYGSLTANTTGAGNTAIGRTALENNTTASDNVAVGRATLSQNTTGANNTAVGSLALLLNTTGVQNTAVGSGAGDASTTANNNTSLGYAALSTASGNQNTALGSQSLYNNTAANNTAVGYAAGFAVTSGTHNVVMGSEAGDNATTGDDNVLIGYSVCSHNVNLTTGGQNTIVGSYADTTAAGTNYANAFGHDISAEGGYTTIGVATNDIRAAHGNITWATVSDERYKKDITDSTAGLAFINALKPRTWKYKTLGELPETFTSYKEGSTEVFKNTQTNHGFIAQEVKAAIDADDSIKDGFRLWDDRDDGSQEVAEAALIPVLVKAIQEQSALITTLTDRIAALEG